MPSNDAKALSEWVTAVARELGLEEALDSLGVVDLVLDLTSDVAHGVSRPGAPVTAFLVGCRRGTGGRPGGRGARLRWQDQQAGRGLGRGRRAR